MDWVFCYATASLQFQPTRRPQIAAQKAKAKAIASKFAPPTATASSTTVLPPPPPAEDAVSTPEPPVSATQPPQPVKSTLADWTADDDDINNFYGEKRLRGGRKKRRKNREIEEISQNWDDVYDPSRPNSYEEYKNSDEKVREVRDWKDVLYAHRLKRRDSSDYDSDRSEGRPVNSKFQHWWLLISILSTEYATDQFAPPSSMSFAPPSNINADTPPPPPPAEIPDDATGDDAYARRMRLNQSQQQHFHPPPPPPSPHPASSSAPVPTAQISRAPVRYSLPSAPAELLASEAELEAKLAEDDTREAPGNTSPDADQSRSSRPGQTGFAERLLSKYGWTKGSGLGAQGTGIVNPLYAKVDKRKKKSDAEGGGFVTPAGTGKILGGQKSKAKQEEEEGKFGAMSEVVKLEGMLRGLDLDIEFTREGGGIMQEIGEECAEKYGTVERVYIDRDGGEADGGVVFVQFVSPLSALRAVNALEGRVFGGNVIKARFWDREKFDQGLYV